MGSSYGLVMVSKACFDLEYSFLISQIFFARSIKLLSCCCWAKVESFEHGWSYRKKSNAGKFVFSFRFIHKNFWLVRGPVSVRFPVLVLLMVISKKICRKIPFVILVHLHIKFSQWSGVRFSARFPVIVLLIVVSKYF